MSNILLYIPVTLIILVVLDTLELRDPFALVPIHFACGALGLLLAPLGAESSAHFVIQLVAVLAIAFSSFAIGCLIVFPFVKLKLLSKRGSAGAGEGSGSA